MQSEETPNRLRGDERRQVLIIFAMRISAGFCHLQSHGVEVTAREPLPAEVAFPILGATIAGNIISVSFLVPISSAHRVRRAGCYSGRDLFGVDLYPTKV